MSFVSRILAVALTAMLAFGGLALAGCNSDNGGDQKDQAAEQDNCYGDDLPVINNTSN